MMHQNKEEMSGKNIKNLDFYAGILFIRSHMYLRQDDSTQHSNGKSTQQRAQRFWVPRKLQSSIIWERIGDDVDVVKYI